MAKNYKFRPFRRSVVPWTSCLQQVWWLAASHLRQLPDMVSMIRISPLWVHTVSSRDYWNAIPSRRRCRTSHYTNTTYFNLKYFSLYHPKPNCVKFTYWTNMCQHCFVQTSKSSAFMNCWSWREHDPEFEPNLWCFRHSGEIILQGWEECHCCVAQLQALLPVVFLRERGLKDRGKASKSLNQIRGRYVHRVMITAWVSPREKSYEREWR